MLRKDLQAYLYSLYYNIPNILEEFRTYQVVNLSKMSEQD